jgi:hypothetical protein
MKRFLRLIYLDFLIMQMCWRKKSEKSPFDIFLAFVDIVGMTKVAWPHFVQ